ncbi:MAG: ribonuclease E inhibitor RraB [Acidobacteria bacterium]|nr:ribonuclease E inhibitor RraB [Acidobacteriota bacterium]
MDFNTVESQLDGIREIFETARREDGWNLDEEMLFSYYFVDTDIDKLEQIGLDLEKQGYDFIGIFELGDEESDEPTGEYMLQLDRVERHTPESLAARNVELQKLADDNGLASYDGWEFGEDGDFDEDEDEEQ